MKLPEIDITTISDPQVRNAIEKIMQAYILLQEENSKLKAEIARLKGQPRKPQFNTSDNQQSHGVTNLLKEKGTWHKSSKGKLPIDREEQLAEVDQCECGSRQFRSLRTTTKVVQGILFQRNNVAYRGRHKECINCGRKYKSILPEELKGISFDPNLKSLLSYLKFACRMTYPLLSRMLTGIGIQMSNGEINKILLGNGDHLKPTQEHLRTVGFAKSTYLQSDASGAKRKEKRTGKISNQYIQVISNKFLSVFSITKHYNAKSLNRLLGREGRKKPFVSDDGSPNGECLKCKNKQLCWVHEIRHYQKQFPFFNAHQELQGQILTQWQNFYHLAKHYGESPPGKMQEKKEEIQNLFDQITSQITGYDLLDKQLRLTKKKKERLLLFLDHPELPIHNNQCEQDIRQFVIIRKISGETKSVRGDRSIERHLSVIQTAQKQGRDVFQTLNGLLTGQLSPAILTANVH
ncbi:MAG: IS66 family transposase [Candidatus Levyibacteriota bacterium]